MPDPEEQKEICSKCGNIVCLPTENFVCSKCGSIFLIYVIKIENKGEPCPIDARFVC